MSALVKLLGVPSAAILLAFGQLPPTQTGRAADLLAHALHLADLYNWADAAPEFAEAEALFNSAGDRRNALYARLGRIRANIDVTSAVYLRYPPSSLMSSATIPCSRPTKNCVCSA